MEDLSVPVFTSGHRVVRKQAICIIPTSSVVIVMGVAGAGKTTVGTLLADSLQCPFIDSDDHQTPYAIKKLAAGQRLDDNERNDWLLRIRCALSDALKNKNAVVLAFPGLRKADREIVEIGNARTNLVYLKASYTVLESRIRSREHRFFNPSLLESEYATLEEPTDALVLDATERPDRLVAQIERRFYDLS